MKIKFSVAILTVSIILNGCSQNNSEISTQNSEAKITLSLFHNASGVPANTIKDVCDKFTADTGIQIYIQSPKNNYEEVMRTKMASNSMPDVWATHGWSVNRYSQYLRPINDQPFADKIVDSIRLAITDKDGKIYTLPINMELSGILYNEDVVKNSDVNVDEIRTWNDFELACGKIKEAGYIPIYFGGLDSWMFGQYFDYAASSLYTLNSENNFSSQFLDGSFDWNNWTDVCIMLDRWNKNGYINSDCLSTDYMKCAQMMGEGKVGFVFSGNSLASDAIKSNPNANIGMMPIPTVSPNDEPVLITGESTAFGVWNETEYMDESLSLLNYFAEPEICSIIANSNLMPSAIEGVINDTGNMKKYYEKYRNIKTVPYFDRQYLPSGMWNELSLSGALILSGRENAVTEAVEHVKKNFEVKFVKK